MKENDEKERWKNLIFFGIHATNKEMEDVPVVGIIIGAILFIVICYFLK